MAVWRVRLLPSPYLCDLGSCTSLITVVLPHWRGEVRGRRTHVTTATKKTNNTAQYCLDVVK